MKKTILAFILSATALPSCDSGDIYPVRIEERNDNIAISGDFILRGDAGAQNFSLCLAAFEEDNASPVVWTNVIKGADTDTVHLTLSNIPPQSVAVRLCLLSIGRRSIYDFFSYDISGAVSDAEIPLTEVALKINYGKIQDIFERNTCTACHGAESGGAGLLLDAAVSYENLVNRQALNSGKMRVEPFSTDGSFLLDALVYDIPLSHPHGSIVYNQDDINLLRAWIELGAEQ
ncbi:MAG: hypothetical protein LBJ58_06090 [Tannerellaceae bacterium]|jgi:hypothetical protein|nr:hypothetical protein [Tannerellaceae bacterium]